MDSGEAQGPVARLRSWLGGFFFGAAMSWVLAPQAIKRRRNLEQMFMLVSVTELVGVPLAPSLTGLRLLPFVVPQIMTWRRRLRLWDDDLEYVDIKHLGH